MPTPLTTAATWDSIRAWLEAALLPATKENPTPPTRLEIYKIKVLQRATGCNDTVYRYLNRKPHRGSEASPPAAAQLAKFLPLMIALDYPNLRIVPDSVAR